MEKKESLHVNIWTGFNLSRKRFAHSTWTVSVE